MNTHFFPFFCFSFSIHLSSCLTPSVKLPAGLSACVCARVCLCVWSVCGVCVCVCVCVECVWSVCVTNVRCATTWGIIVYLIVTYRVVGDAQLCLATSETCILLSSPR